MSHHHKPFYDVEIIRNNEEAYIESLLAPFRKEPATEELKKKIWDILQNEKFLGNLKIPFKVILKKDPSGTYADCIEIILDTKV